MVFSPRQSLGFFVTQDFTLVGANEGYRSIVQRVFSADTGLFGLNNSDLATLKPAAYAVPTYVAYGSKDVMTAQVDGVRAILYNAHKADNWNVTVRSYPVANHVLRLGDESEAGTPFADAYVDDLIDWAVGTSAGLTQTSEKVAGTNLYQSIGLPGALKARRVGTIYGVILHVTVYCCCSHPSCWHWRRWAAKSRRMPDAARETRGQTCGHADTGTACDTRFRTWFRQRAADFDPHHSCHTAHLLCRTWTGDYGCGQTCMGQRSYRDAGRHVLELAGHPSGVRAGAMGLVPRLYASDRSRFRPRPDSDTPSSRIRSRHRHRC